MAPKQQVGYSLLFTEASPSQSDTSRSVGILWTIDQSNAEISAWQHTTLRRNRIHAPAGFEPAIPASE